ncbi:MAG: sugar transferase [Synechococcales cyanobacterium CRU_2_2]|nr:sugar transferase [Synechococcales cyanobacterium CRU_2_2]
MIQGLRKGIRTKWLRVILLLMTDLLAFYLVWPITQYFNLIQPQVEVAGEAISLKVLVITAQIAFLASGGLYREGELRRDYGGCLRVLALADIFLVLITAFSGATTPSSLVSLSLSFSLFWSCSVIAICIGRFCVEGLVQLIRKLGWARYSAFIIAEAENQALSQELIAKEGRYNILGNAESQCLDRANRDALINRIKTLGVDEIFTDWDSIRKRTFLFRRLQSAGATLRILPLTSDIAAQHGKLWSVDQLTLFTLAPPTIVGLDFFIKRCFDFLVSVVVLILFAPLYLAIALCIKLDSPGPVFYRQWRVGLHGKEFRVWKFRSMSLDAEQAQAQLEQHNEMADGILFKLKDDPRVTRVGKFIRRYSLDEIPQVFNVLRGDMSIVGPRPLPIRDVQRFSQESFYIRHEVLPGITGLWQVSGRSDIEDFAEAVALDMKYIESWSLQLDLMIMLKTVLIVFCAKGAY